jgi:hypothetical protein
MLRTLFLTIVVLYILWIFVVPIWHFPDEQAHFGQVAYLTEEYKNSNKIEKYDLTYEIYMSEVFLGTVRDNSGNNKFTFHPKYKIPYSDNFEGLFEASIAAIVKSPNRGELVIKESSQYPPLYYIPATLVYKLFYNSDLFVRVYAVRFWSLALFALNIYFVYLLAKLLFGKNILLRLILTTMVAFQPMMIFANIGVNSDSLGNLFFTIFLFLSIKLIINGCSLNNLVLIFILTCLSIYTKPQFIIIIPLLSINLLFVALRDFKSKNSKFKLIFSSIILTLIILFLLYFAKIGPATIIFRFFQRLNIISLFKFTWEYSLSHTYSEVLPWYWGIYDWLGVTYPRLIHRLINWTILLSIIGLVKYIFLVVRNKKLKSRNVQAGVFLVFISAVYFIAICFYDWLSWYTQGYQLGVQGRYFFPVISVHMLLILIGWRELFPDIKGIREKGIKILGIMMIALNFYALYTVAKTYYNLWPVEVFIKQVSQYKPWFVKGWGFIFVSAFFLSSLIVFLIEYIKYSHDKKKSNHQ